MEQQTPWYLFWNSLTSDEKRLFRLLQRTHSELGKNVQMFSVSHLGPKHEIEEYVMEKFSVDLNNLPRDR